MRISVKTILIILFLSTVAFNQIPTREQKILKIKELTDQIKVLEAEILSPDSKDLIQAKQQGLEAFRLIPRENSYISSLNGNGAYYSFTNKTNDYQKIAQLSLQRNFFEVGFGGADYGFIADLEKMPLENISTETSEISFLADYKPPANEPEIRIDQDKAGLEDDKTFPFKDRASVNLEHTYVLRAISFNRADILVAFKIYRKDTDGSLIIFWKLLKNFEKPLIARN